MESVLELLIRARDEASGVVKDLGNNLDKTAKKTQDLSQAFKVAGGIITGAGVAGVALMKNWASLAGEVEVANKQLEHAVLGVSHATQAQLEQTMQLSDALEKKGVLDGDNIKIGLAQLSTFGLSNKAVQGLGGALADLAVNQFGVNASGEQLSQTANMIAKALNNQFGVLEKSGIRFTDAQKKMIEFGSEMDKVKAINEGFNQNLKYTNEVALTTTEGKSAHAQVALQNLGEALGKSLNERLKVSIGYFGDFLENLNKLDPKVMDNIANVILFGTALALIIGPLLILIGFLPSLVAGFGLLVTTGIGPLLLVVGALGLAIGLMVANWKEIQPVLQPVIDFFVNLFNIVKTEIMSFITENVPLFQEAWEKIKFAFQLGLQIVSDMWNAVWPSLAKTLESVWGIIKGIVQTAWGFIQIFIALGLGALTGDWTKAWNMIKDGFADVWSGIGGILMNAWNFILNVIETKINAIIGMINGFIDKINSLAGKSGAGIGKLGTVSMDNFKYTTDVPSFNTQSAPMSSPTMQSTPTVNNYNQAISINGNMSSSADLNTLGYQVAWALRNTK